MWLFKLQASEARTLTMLREELAAAEARLEDERFGAASARQNFSAREQELEVGGLLLDT